jgi:hypothetical protein
MEKQLIDAAREKRAAFFLLANHPLKFRLYLLAKLPAAYFSGLRVVKADAENCLVSVPYKHFTRNPFRSTYFACLSMAAELSTGLLAMANVYRRQPAVSMLITGVEAQFHKKATGLTTFSCVEGAKIKEAVEAAIQSGEGQQLKVCSTGINGQGEAVASFWFTWSFKRK